MFNFFFGYKQRPQKDTTRQNQKFKPRRSLFSIGINVGQAEENKIQSKQESCCQIEIKKIDYCHRDAIA